MASKTTMNIKVISEDLIKPSCPTPNHLRSLRASLFDHVNSPLLMPLIFFYSKTSSLSTTNIGTNQILDRLKESLRDALSMFYPLAGRFFDANQISCNDEGVPYVQAEVNKPLEDVVRKAELSQLDKLLPSYGQEGYTSLLLAIQVNVFSCGGLAIGVMMSHAISDGFSLLMFVKTWASIANGSSLNTHMKLPYFEICKRFPPPSTQDINDMGEYANLNPDLVKNRPVSKWFLFTKNKLDTIRSKIFSSNNNKNSSTSDAMVLSAFLWSRIKATCYNSANKIPHEVFHAVNLRPRVTPPGDNSYYFGNMVVNAIIELPMLSNIDSNYTNESRCLYDFLEQMKESIEKISNDRSIKNMQEGKEDLRFIMEHFERASKGEIISLGFSNGGSLPVYESDFGWGKPIWVTSATLVYQDLIVLIPASPSSKDIVAYINLSGDNMAKLESDTQFMAIASNGAHVHSKM